jgi:hypothetical protein
MRLWADSDEVTPGYWFRTEPDAAVLPGHHPWRKRSTWCVGQPQAAGPGEVYPPQAPYYLGGNPLGYPGTSTCGPPDALLHGGVHGVHEPLTTEPDGSLACCFAAAAPAPPLSGLGAWVDFVPTEDPPTFNFGVVATTETVFVAYVHTGSVIGSDPAAAVAGWTTVQHALLPGINATVTVYRRQGAGVTVSWTSSVSTTFGRHTAVSLRFASPTVTAPQLLTRVGPSSSWGLPAVTLPGGGRLLLFLAAADPSPPLPLPLGQGTPGSPSEVRDLFVPTVRYAITLDSTMPVTAALSLPPYDLAAGDWAPYAFGAAVVFQAAP